MAESASQRRPAWWAIAVVTAWAVGTWAVYNTSGRAVAERVIGAYAASLVLGPSLAFVTLRLTGASGRAAVAGALVVPILWLLKEMYRVTAVFSIPEALYYALNPMAMGIYVAIAIQLAVAEVVVRRRRSGRWRLRWAPAVTLALIGAFAATTYAVGHDSGGRDVFYTYIAVYRWLFPGP